MIRRVFLLVLMLVGVARAQPSPPSPPQYATNCRTSPRYGTTMLCFDTTAKGWFSWDDASHAFIPLPGLGGVSVTTPPAGSGQCLVSTSITTGNWGSCAAAGNLPAIPPGGGKILSEDTVNPQWVACAGDITCSSVTPGTYTVTKINGNTPGGSSPAHQFVNAIDSSGRPSSAQPDMSDLTGVATELQGGTGTNYGAPGAKVQYANSGMGTTCNTLTWLNAGQAEIAPAGQTSGIIGIATAGCGATGTATIQLSGITTCQFSTGVVYGHCVQVDSLTAGLCVDGGTTCSGSGQAVGVVVDQTNPATGTYKISLGAGSGGGGGGGSPANALTKGANLSDVQNAATSFANIGGGSAGKLAAPSPGNVTGFEALEQTPNNATGLPVNASDSRCTGSSPNITCTLACTANNGGNYPSWDWYNGTLNGTDIPTWALPTSGCVNNDIIATGTIQGSPAVSITNSNYTTAAAGGIVGDLCPNLGGSSGNKQQRYFQFDTADSTWVQHCGINVPSTGGTVAAGYTGLTSITLHDLLVGNGTSPLTLLPPSSTSGLPLISQGASSNPAFGALDLSNGSLVSNDLGVAHGGTALGTWTAHGIPAGNTTSAPNFIAPGATGTVLTGQGASADPVFGTLQSVNIMNSIGGEQNTVNQLMTVNTVYDLLYNATSGFTIPANTLNHTHGVVLSMHGAILNATSDSDTIQLTVGFGATNPPSPLIADGTKNTLTTGVHLGTSPGLPQAFRLVCAIQANSSGSFITGVCDFKLVGATANSNTSWSGTGASAGSVIDNVLVSQPGVSLDGTIAEILRVTIKDTSTGNATVKVFGDQISAF